MNFVVLKGAGLQALRAAATWRMQNLTCVGL